MPFRQPPSGRPATTGAVVGASAEMTGRDVARLYEISGLTYKQIARIFGVSDRSVHAWAAGTIKPVARHLERLSTILDAVRALDATDATSRRASLINNRGSQPSIYNTWLRGLAAGREPNVNRLHEPARHS